MKLTKEYILEQKDVIKRCQQGAKTWRKSEVVQERHKILKDFCKGAKTILSVGCAGLEPIELNATDALDVHSLAGVYLYKGGWKGTFKVGDCCAMPYWEDQFDVAVCDEVIEHLPELKDVIDTFKELNRVAKNWIITTPAAKVDEPTHKRLFDLYTLKKCLKYIECSIERRGRYWYVFHDSR